MAKQKLTCLVLLDDTVTGDLPLRPAAGFRAGDIKEKLPTSEAEGARLKLLRKNSRLSDRRYKFDTDPQGISVLKWMTL